MKFGVIGSRAKRGKKLTGEGPHRQWKRSNGSAEFKPVSEVGYAKRRHSMGPPFHMAEQDI